MTLTKQNYVKEAEEVVKQLKVRPERKSKGGYMESTVKPAREHDKKNGGDRNFLLTTSKIRNLLSMISEIYTETLHISDSSVDEDCIEKLQYLKMRFAYEAGREPSVKDLIEKGKILDQIDDIGDSKEKCIIFCRYMESIVAYHKFYGGKDQ